MSLVEYALPLVERVAWPDAVARAGVRYLVSRTSRKLGNTPPMTPSFAQRMSNFPIAVHTDDANSQHYEVPAAFFDLMLGPQRKYSSCYYDNPKSTLADAEESALARTAENAGLRDGQDILELGCGWGSLSLWMARHYPKARIVSVSNSNSQRLLITQRAREAGLTNLRVVTCDINAFTPETKFDRVVSVEMFEHMSNWRGLLGRIHEWLKPDGRLFFHVFSHRSTPYRFDHEDKSDWIAQHFFTGGIMPSHDLALQFPDLFKVEQEWRWSGTHYARTARHWLENLDSHRSEVERILASVYGADAGLWHRRWRLFLLATEGLFGYADGTEWGISHYRLKPA